MSENRNPRSRKKPPKPKWLEVILDVLIHYILTNILEVVVKKLVDWIFN